MRPTILAILIASSSFVIGCAAKRTTATDNGGETTGWLEQAADASIDQEALAADLFPLQPGTEHFAIRDENGRETGRVTITREATTEHGAIFARREDSGRTQFVRTDDQGNIVMTAVLEPDDHALSLFDPPLVIAPAKLTADAPQVFKADMRVVDSKDTKKEREKGTATRTIRLLGQKKVRTPMGEFAALKIGIEFSADLKLAKATDHTIIFVVPGRGIVAEVSQENVKVLGAFGKSKHRTIVRQD
jgi:hypothetical protein